MERSIQAWLARHPRAKVGIRLLYECAFFAFILWAAWEQNIFMALWATASVATLEIGWHLSRHDDGGSDNDDDDDGGDGPTPIGDEVDRWLRARVKEEC